MRPDDFQQIDVSLTEDGKSVWLEGYLADETCFIQVIDLPIPIQEENMDREEWRKAAHPDKWRPLV